MTEGEVLQPGTERVTPLFPDFGGFSENRQFSTFLETLPQCFGRPVFVNRAFELWCATVGDVSGDLALEEFTEFLRRYRFTQPKAESDTDPAMQERMAGFAEKVSELMPAFPDEEDPCYYFPAGRAFNDSLDDALGSLNPVPVIAQGLRAVFGDQDKKQEKVQEVEISEDIERLIESLIEWVAQQNEDDVKDSVRATLQMCCWLPERYRDSQVEYGSVKSLQIALNTPDPLRDLAIGRWGFDLDYETDDRLVRGIGILSQLSLINRVELDDEFARSFGEVGVELSDRTGRPVPVDILPRMLSCLYCRYLAEEDDAPDWVCELPRLFAELDQIGISMEGRSPVCAADAYLIGDLLYMIDAIDQDLLCGLDPCDSAYAMLGRATRRDHGFFDPDYFDVGAYIRAPGALSTEDPYSRFDVFQAFGRAAEKLGLRRLSAASMSFFLITQLAGFKGELKTEWSLLEDELQRLLAGPGRELVESAVVLAISIAEENSVEMNVLRLKEIAGDTGLAPQAENIRPILTAVDRDPRLVARYQLTSLIGDSEWAVLLVDTQEQLIDGWVQVKRSRVNPVNPEISRWGPIALHFTNALEYDLSQRARPVIDSSSLKEFFAGFGPSGKLPKHWTFGQIVGLLQKYSKFDAELQSAVDAAGLQRLCGVDARLLQRIGEIVNLRNAAAHPENSSPFTEAHLQQLLDKLFTKGLIASYARSLATRSEQD